MTELLILLAKVGNIGVRDVNKAIESSSFDMLPPKLLEQLQSKHIVLASSSKTREKLLKLLNINVEVCIPEFDENLDPDEYSVFQYVEETALGKVLNVEERLNDKGVSPDIIIGADTMVEHEGKLYGKPKSKSDVVATLTRLTSSGSPAIVHTGVVIKSGSQVVKFVESTTVYIGTLSQEEILAYADNGEAIIAKNNFLKTPTNRLGSQCGKTINWKNENDLLNNAGGFAIQGLAGCFIEKIDGDFNNVTGLPLCRLRKELLNFLNYSGLTNSI